MNNIRILIRMSLTLLITCSFGIRAESFVPVMLEAVKNTLSSECAVQDTVALAKQTTYFAKPLAVPFISIRNYLTEYTANRPYIPQKALSIETEFGRFRLWANEQGIVCAPDLKQKVFSLDEWETETLFSTTKGTSPLTEQDLQKRYLVLVLKLLKNKLKLVLQPA